MEKIETFYAIDYDRCLGDFDANVALLSEIAEEKSTISQAMLRQALDEVKSSGRSFRLLQYLQENDPLMDIDAVLVTFIQRAKAKPGCLLETGALDLIDFFQSRKLPHCIMSFGDERWQNVKITASGLASTVALIVSHERKSEIISEWWDETDGHYVIPGECFSSKVSKVAKEVVLIDDKPSAFVHLSKGARGYLVSGGKGTLHTTAGKLPSGVTKVKDLSEIIELESMKIGKYRNR